MTRTLPSLLQSVIGESTQKYSSTPEDKSLKKIFDERSRNKTTDQLQRITSMWWWVSPCQSTVCSKTIISPLWYASKVWMYCKLIVYTCREERSRSIHPGFQIRTGGTGMFRKWDRWRRDDSVSPLMTTESCVFDVTP